MYHATMISIRVHNLFEKWQLGSVPRKEGRKEVTERVVKKKRSIEEEEAPQKCSSNVPTLKCDPGNYQSELNAPTMYLGSIAYRWCFHNSGLISPTTPFGQCNDDDDARQEF